ncbi:MAG: hypothetical protein MJY89_06895 [Bacteroidales bacterium]|nr:hypothetical protein [Bacteroidales bacterium]
MTDENYGLDLHCSMILDEYREMKPVFETIKGIVLKEIRNSLNENGILITALESRIKTEKSLAGKLALKGQKYHTIDDITDILGCRVITFYSDEVDKIAALVQAKFNVDWDNSVDKRKQHSLESFGYMSLHYICRIPQTLYFDADHPEINSLRFEVQMRTAIQHVWANMYHDTGYKSGVEIPQEHLRNLNRLAGMLELADDEFSRIRIQIKDYRRKVQALVKDGNFDEVMLNGDTFKSYLQLEPFKLLNERIAAINQAEIQEVNAMSFLEPLKNMGFKTLGDVEKMKNDYSELAYRLAVHQIGKTDLDIISSTIGLQNLCITYLMKNGAGVNGLESFFDSLNGPSPYNRQQAERIVDLINRIKLKHATE